MTAAPVTPTSPRATMRWGWVARAAPHPIATAAAAIFPAMSARTGTPLTRCRPPAAMPVQVGRRPVPCLRRARLSRGRRHLTTTHCYSPTAGRRTAAGSCASPESGRLARQVTVRNGTACQVRLLPLALARPPSAPSPPRPCPRRTRTRSPPAWRSARPPDFAQASTTAAVGAGAGATIVAGSQDSAKGRRVAATANKKPHQLLDYAQTMIGRASHHRAWSEADVPATTELFCIKGHR